jgi:hypothetical protein
VDVIEYLMEDAHASAAFSLFIGEVLSGFIIALMGGRKTPSFVRDYPPVLTV